MTQSPDCPFCRIVAGQVLATIVYKDDLVTAFRDINPQAPTHILLVPNHHVAGMNEFAEGDANALTAILLAAREIARKEGIADSGYRLVANQGRDAGQSVFHLHFHLLGGRRMKWPPG
ncbi:MAG: histidine triad nucleotide-binding protein [Chloroflexi bacterium]|nr:histidine triad nucleotide-binding protein [Chloroflexota bacterium]